MLTADISLLGVRLPRHRYHHRSAALKSLGAGAPVWLVGGGQSGLWCGLLTKSKRRKLWWELVTFSLSGFKMHTYPPAVALCLLSLIPSFPPWQCRTASCIFFPFLVFGNRSPLRSLCAQVWTFFFLLLFHFCFLLALTSNHLTRNEWMNAWKWLCVMLKLGNVFLQHVNIFFSFHSLSLWIDFCFVLLFFLSPDCKNKTKKKTN